MGLALTEEQTHIIRSLACFSGTIAVIGSLMLILSFALFKELRTYSSRLILYLSIADLGEAVAWVLSPGSDNINVCYVQGYGQEFFAVAGITWQVCIAAYILQVTMDKKSFPRQELIFNLVAWGIPSIIMIGGGIKGIFGTAGPWCWVRSPEYSTVGLGILYIPFLVAITFTSSIYIRVGFLLKRKSKEAMTVTERIQLQQKRIRLRTRFYLLPFALGWTFGLTNRLHNTIDPVNKIAALYALHALFFPLQGFWNFLMYGLSERIVGPDRIAEILANPKCHSFFVEFLENHHARENFDFWQLVENLKTVPVGTSEWTTRATAIFEEFVSTSAPREVNVSGGVRNQLRAQLTMPPLLKAQEEVVELMQQSVFFFMKTDIYGNLLKELQSSNTLTGSVRGKLLITALYHKVLIILNKHESNDAMYKRMSSVAAKE